MSTASRGSTELEDLINHSAKTGLTIATVTGDLDPSTDTERLLGRILASVARGEVERKGARQRAAAAQRTAQGKPSVGPRGFGYSSDGWSLVEEEATVVRKAYDLMLASGSVRSVARLHNDSGSTTNRGNEWKTFAVRSLLMNPRYADLTWAPGPRDHRVITGHGKWPAIVTEETCRAVHDLLDPKRLPLVRSRAVREVRRPHRRGQQLPRRQGLPLQGLSPPLASRRRRRRLRHRRRLHRLTRPDAGQLLDDTDRPDAARLRSDAVAKRASLDNLVSLVADGTLSAEQARTSIEKVKAEVADIEERVIHAGRGDVLGSLIHAAKVEEAWKSLDLDSRRAVVRALFDEVVIGAPGRGSKAFNSDSIALVVTLDGRRVRYAPELD